MASAKFEGIVFRLRDSPEIFRELGICTDQIISSGGSARSDLLLQIQANMSNANVRRATIQEKACVGAGILAGGGSTYANASKTAYGRVDRYDERVFELQKDVVEK